MVLVVISIFDPKSKKNPQEHPCDSQIDDMLTEVATEASRIQKLASHVLKCLLPEPPERPLISKTSDIHPESARNRAQSIKNYPQILPRPFPDPPQPHQTPPKHSGQRHIRQPFQELFPLIARFSPAVALFSRLLAGTSRLTRRIRSKRS